MTLSVCIPVYIILLLVWIGARKFSGWGAGTCRPMVIVLGSGGHTAEMISMLSTLPKPRKPHQRTYILAKGDINSLAKITQFELDRADQSFYHVHTIPRARMVGQSIYTAPFTTLWALVYAFWIMYRNAPPVLLCNGPGTCLPVCIASGFLNFFGLVHSRTVMVESFARVDTLSLTAKFIYHLRLGLVVVQWPALQKSYPRTQYKGMLV